MKDWYNRTVVTKWLTAVMDSKEHAEVRREIVPLAHGTVLEIGAGPGYNFPFYTSITKLYALEPSRELGSVAHERATQATFPVAFIYAPAEAIPLPDASIDSVVSTWTLCSVHNPEAVMREIVRVLRPGGTFIFAEHGASPHVAIRALQTTVTVVSKHLTGNCHNNRPIEQLIRDAKLTIEHITYPREESFHPLIFNYQGVARRPL